MRIARVGQALLLASLLLGLSARVAPAQEIYADNAIDIGLVVSDLDASAAFYEGVLGLKRVSTFSVDSALSRRLGLTKGVPFSAVVLKLGEEAGAPALKLVRVGEVPRSRPEFINEEAGIRYLTVRVRALGPMLERLRSRGVPVLGEAPVALGNRNYFALVQDPDGVFVELIGPM